MDCAGPRGGGHLGGFGAVTSERPLAINVLFRRERRKNQVAVIRHPDAYRDEVDVGRGDQGEGIVVGRADSERLRRGVGAGPAGGRHRRKLHILQAAQRWDVGIPGPAAIRVGADDADAQRPCHAIPSSRWWAGQVTLRHAAICWAVTIIRFSVIRRATLALPAASAWSRRPDRPAWCTPRASLPRRGPAARSGSSGPSR